MTTLPTVRNGAQCLYPFTKRVIFDTGISYNCDGTEVRRLRRPVLFEFEWNWNTLIQTDAAALVAAFQAQSGMYANDLQFTLGSTTYSNLSFLQDAIDATMRRLPAYSVQSLKARQVVNASYTYPAGGSAWPTFSSGAALQYPYTSGYRNLTTSGTSPTGRNYSWKWWGNGLTHFPAGPLRRFQVEMTLPDADAATLEAFFLTRRGSMKAFDFSDPFAGSAYYKIRFASDTLELRYEDVQRVRATVQLIETN